MSSSTPKSPANPFYVYYLPTSSKPFPLLLPVVGDGDCIAYFLYGKKGARDIMGYDMKVIKNKFSIIFI